MIRVLTALVLTLSNFAFGWRAIESAEVSTLLNLVY